MGAERRRALVGWCSVNECEAPGTLRPWCTVERRSFLFDSSMARPAARLASLVQHLTVGPQNLAAVPPAESTQQQDGEDGHALPLLSGQQMADFVMKGYVLVQPEEGEGQELPPGFHANFYDRVEDLMRNPAHEGNRDLGLMTPEINQLLRAPSCHGALRSILGEGFAVASWGNGTPLLHNPQDTDQGWHKVRIHQSIVTILVSLTQ